MFSIASIEAAQKVSSDLNRWFTAVTKARLAALEARFDGDQQHSLRALIFDDERPAFSQIDDYFEKGTYDGVLVSNDGEEGAVRVAFSPDSTAFWTPDMTGNQEPLFFDKHPHTWQQDRWIRVSEAQGACAQAPIDAFVFLGDMPQPELSLARCACHDVQFIGIATDLVEDGQVVYDRLDQWIIAAGTLAQSINEKRCAHCIPHVPPVKIVAGVQAKNAAAFDDALVQTLTQLAANENTCALFCELACENDASQRAVFMHILALASTANLPVVVSAPQCHKFTWEMVQASGIPANRVVLRVGNATLEQAKPWIEAGCILSFDGTLTHPDAHETRALAAVVPLEQLLTESGAPCPAPWPLRNVACQPDYVAFTAEALASARECQGLEQEEQLKHALADTAARLFL